ncbi:ABC transporter ATP-binding protein [candidate division KSB1 bacterium]|nr:ABC transporter ATP-binding protein [candidate division KSB1 bacterium]
MLRLQNISKSYPSPATLAEVTVLQDISLTVTPGASLAILGPSGSGKSTLLNIIGALEKPTSGLVEWEGNDLYRLPDDELARIRNEQIGFVFQLHHLLPQLTVLENVLIPTLPLKTSKQAEPRARELLNRVGLDHHLHHRPAQLSGGERQRVAVVRAMINQPKLVLADEPTGSLDHLSALKLADILLGLNAADNVTLIIVTHSMDLAKKLKTVYVLEDGRLKNLHE